MTNQEKYKTTLERAKAMRLFCERMWDNGVHCAKCPFHTCESEKVPVQISCVFKWLEKEADEEARPCPICGKEIILEKKHLGASENSKTFFNFECNKCDIYTRIFTSEIDEAIKKWNKMVNKYEEHYCAAKDIHGSDECPDIYKNLCKGEPEKDIEGEAEKDNEKL